MVHDTPQNCNSNIKNHSKRITITNIIINKKFEILQELSKCDTDTVGKMMLIDLLDVGLPPSVCTKCNLCKVQ